jgi:hypothetical protein
MPASSKYNALWAFHATDTQLALPAISTTLLEISAASSVQRFK